MSVKVASGSSNELSRVVAEVTQHDVKVVVFFFSPEMESQNPQAEFARAFPKATRLGASMIGGWASAGPVDKGLVAMTLGGDEVEEVSLSFQEGVKKDPTGVARSLVSDVRSKWGQRALDPEHYVGIVLFDGLCLGEKIVHELSAEKNFVFPIIGGAAADELAFRRTLVVANDKLSADGAVLAVLKMRVPFFYDHYVHFKPTSKTSIVTRSEPDRRVVWTLDGVNAADRYAQLLGLSSAQQIQGQHFSRNPLGVVIGDTVYARSPNAVVDGKGLQFYCSIEAGTRVSVLEKGDLIQHTREGLAKTSLYLKKVQAVLFFNCVLRYLEMKEDRLIEPFNALFQATPFIGFNTYGEELFTHHNQTLTALFIGEKEEA
jgi:hypothetical protein